MTVPFNAVPGNTRVPFFWAEINAGGTPFDNAARLLLIGQKMSAGLAVTNVPIRYLGDGAGQFGSGSMLQQMCDVAIANAGPLQEIWALPIVDDGAAVAATGTFAISAAPTITGELTVYIAGQPVRIAVSAADTAIQVATRLAAAINTGFDLFNRALPVTASNPATPNDHKCTITAKNLGALGNKIRLEVDYYGNEGPLGAAMVTITAMASGATDPSLTVPIATLGDQEFDFIASPYADSTSLGIMTTFLDNISGRWSPYQQLYGVYFTSLDDTSTNLLSAGAARNDANLTIMGHKNSPSPPWAWASAYAAVATRLQDISEISRPLQTLPLLGILPPKALADRFNATVRQSLYGSGIASYKVDAANQVVIDRAVTTYRLNSAGVADGTWLDVEDRFKAVFAVRYLRDKVSSQHGRSALRNDNPMGLPGVATPDTIRDTLVHGYLELSNFNIVENFEAFQAGLTVERSATNANRVDVFVPLDLVNALRIFAVNVTAFLQFPGVPAAA